MAQTVCKHIGRTPQEKADTKALSIGTIILMFRL